MHWHTSQTLYNSVHACCGHQASSQTVCILHTDGFLKSYSTQSVWMASSHATAIWPPATTCMFCMLTTANQWSASSHSFLSLSLVMGVTMPWNLDPQVQTACRNLPGCIASVCTCIWRLCRSRLLSSWVRQADQSTSTQTERSSHLCKLLRQGHDH